MTYNVSHCAVSHCALYKSTTLIYLLRYTLGSFSDRLLVYRKFVITCSLQILVTSSNGSKFSLSTDWSRRPYNTPTTTERLRDLSSLPCCNLLSGEFTQAAAAGSPPFSAHFTLPRTTAPSQLRSGVEAACDCRRLFTLRVVGVDALAVTWLFTSEQPEL